MDFSSIPFLGRAKKSGATFLSAAAFVEVVGGSTVISRPAGATAGDMMVAVMWSGGSGGGAQPATAPAPSGWTAGTGILTNSSTDSARLFYAPGDVSTLTFNTTGAAGMFCFAVRGASTIAHAVGATYFGDSPGVDYPTPSLTVAVGNLVASLYVQTADGTGGAIDGTDIGAYTRVALKNDSPPRLSLLVRVATTAGATGTVSHDANADFATRFGFTAAFN